MLAKESAIEGLYYVRAARTAMGMDPGPELETIAGQKSAGAVTEDRKVQFEGREIEASPVPHRPHAELLPGRPGRRTSGARRLVLRAVVEDGPGGGCVGRGLDAAVRLAVLRDARGRIRRVGLRERLRLRIRPGLRPGYDQGLDAGQGGGDGGGWGGDSGGWGGGDGGGGWGGDGGGLGDFGGGDFGGFGDF